MTKNSLLAVSSEGDNWELYFQPPSNAAVCLVVHSRCLWWFGFYLCWGHLSFQGPSLFTILCWRHISLEFVSFGLCFPAPFVIYFWFHAHFHLLSFYFLGFEPVLDAAWRGPPELGSLRLRPPGLVQGYPRLLFLVGVLFWFLWCLVDFNLPFTNLMPVLFPRSRLLYLSHPIGLRPYRAHGSWRPTVSVCKNKGP